MSGNLGRRVRLLSQRLSRDSKMLLCQAQGKRTPEGVHGRSALEREEGSERLWGLWGLRGARPEQLMQPSKAGSSPPSKPAGLPCGAHWALGCAHAEGEDILFV